MTVPQLSLIIPCRRHDDAGLQRLLASLRRQTFRDYEILVQTEPEGSEYAKACGIRRATGEILGFFCADNDLRDPRFLEVMVRYAKDPRVDGAYTAQYDYVPEDTALSRYFALLGANDPVCWWLGKADRTSYLSHPRGSRIYTCHGAMPSIGDNGFFLKASVARRYLPNPATHFCIDWIEDIRQAKGSVTFWVVAEQRLWHRTGDGCLNWLTRRYCYARDLYFRKIAQRRWIMVASSRDWYSVGVFVLASLLVLPHLVTAIRGYRQRRDLAWFLHPLVCASTVGVYGYAWLEHHVTHWRRLLFRRSTVPTSSTAASGV